MSYIRLVDARIRASDKDLPVKNIMPIVSSFVCQDACSFIKQQTQNVANHFMKLHFRIYLKKVQNHRLCRLVIWNFCLSYVYKSLIQGYRDV